MVAVGGDVGYLGLNALILCVCIGIVGDDGSGGPEGGELAGCKGLTDGGIGVDGALLVRICQEGEGVGGGRDEDGPEIWASPCSVVRSCALAAGTRTAARRSAGRGDEGVTSDERRILKSGRTKREMGVVSRGPGL